MDFETLKVACVDRLVDAADYDALEAAHEQAWKSATSESHAWAREYEARMLVVAERDQLRAELEAIRGQEPAAKLQWPAIVDLVNEVLGCKAHQFPCERGSIGHEMTGINFNSLARIIDRVQHMHAIPPKQPDAWPKLGKPAKVGAVLFNPGLSARLVVEAAQRQHEYSQQPEVEAARLERFSAAMREFHGKQPDAVSVPRELLERIGKLFPADMEDDGSGRAGFYPHVREAVQELRALLTTKTNGVV